MKILFICKGNVGRSQIAEALFRKKFGDAHEVVSAGTALSGPEQPIGELMPNIKEVLDVMQEEGMDVSMYVRNQLTEKMIEDADKVVAIVEEDFLLPEYLLDSPKLIRWNVPDPKGKDLEFTREVKNQIKSFIEEMS
jgi:protein-tyrosine-phosphatase